MQRAMAGTLALVLAGCALSGIGSEKACRCLTISRFPSRSIVAQHTLPESGVFSLSFIHSVSQTPVRDDYQAIDCRIIQTAETFQAHGAGLPSGIDEPGVTGWEHHDGRFVIRMQRPIPRLIVRTDGAYRNRLRIDGKDINLNDWENQAFELAIVPCTVP
jgi:hypothetical protein